MKTLILLLVLLSSAAHAQDSFSIETVGAEVCRTKTGQPKRCLPTFKGLGLLDINQIEIVERVQNHNGGSFVLSPAQASEVLSSYRRLSIRNLATNPALVIVKEGKARIPFFASVYWQGRGFMEGTIHVEGEIVAAKDDARVRASGFADSTTEQKIELLRMLETTARYIHFRIAGTEGKTVDQATMVLLNEVVGPVIIGEIAVKHVSDFAKGLGPLSLK